jgi:hypothetical protein
MERLLCICMEGAFNAMRVHEKRIPHTLQPVEHT